MKHQKGIIYTLLSATTFAITPLIIIKAYQHGATPWEITFTQSVVGSVVLILGLLVFSPKDLKITKKQFKALVPIGLVGSLGATICYNSSLQYLPGGIATLLLYTYPVFVTLGAIFIFGQKFTSKQILALFCGVIGVALAVQILEIGRLQINHFGLILGLFAALAYTILNLFSERVLGTVSAWTATAYIQFGSTFGLITIIFIFPNLINVMTIKPVFWFYGGCLSIVCSIIPVFLLMKGISYIGSCRASIVSTAEIPITLILVFIFLGERFNGLQILGSILVFLSVLILRKEGEEINPLHEKSIGSKC